MLESDIRPGWRAGYVMADINHPVDLLPAFDWKPDVIFLLSAMVSRVTCEQASGLAIATNLGGVNNVLQLAKRAGAGSCFSRRPRYTAPDSSGWTRPNRIRGRTTATGLSKLLGEQLVEYEVRTTG